MSNKRVMPNIKMMSNSRMVLMLMVISVFPVVFSWPCSRHSDCTQRHQCIDGQCVYPCYDAKTGGPVCGQGARCVAINHVATCRCPPGTFGDPFILCRTLSSLCNPNPCGTNAICRPGKDDYGENRPVCSCPKGYFGNALNYCHRGECFNDSECGHHQACFQYYCSDPCSRPSVCGYQAECKVSNHGPVCGCPKGYHGDPLID